MEPEKSPPSVFNFSATPAKKREPPPLPSTPPPSSSPIPFLNISSYRKSPVGSIAGLIGGHSNLSQGNQEMVVPKATQPLTSEAFEAADLNTDNNMHLLDDNLIPGYIDEVDKLSKLVGPPLLQGEVIEMISPPDGEEEEEQEASAESPHSDEVSISTLSDLMEGYADESLLFEIDHSSSDRSSPVSSPDASFAAIRVKYDRDPDFAEIASNEILLLRLFSDLSCQKEDALRYMNTTHNMQRMVDTILGKVPNVPVSPGPLAKQTLEQLAYKLADNVIPHVDETSWTTELICALIYSLKTEDLMQIEPESRACMSAAATLLTAIGIHCGETLVKVIEEKIQKFEEILAGSMWIQPVQQMILAFFNNEHKFYQRWIDYFESRLPKLVEKTVERYARFVPAAGAAMAEYYADLGMDNLEYLTMGIVQRLGESPVGRVFRSPEYLQLLRDLICKGLRPHALIHCMSLLGNILAATKTMYQSVKYTPQALLCFSGEAGDRFFQYLTSLYYSDSVPLSVLDQTTVLLFSFFDVDVESIAESMHRVGVLEAILEGTFVNRSRCNILHSDAWQVFETVMCRSEDHPQRIVDWITSSRAFPIAVELVRSELKLPPSKRNYRYRFFVMILLRVAHLAIKFGEVRQAVENVPFAATFTDMIPKASSQYRDEASWEMTFETPRKQYFRTFNEDTDENENPAQDVDNCSFSTE